MTAQGARSVYPRSPLQKFTRLVQRAERDAGLCKSFGGAFLAVDHGEDQRDLGAGIAHRLCGLAGGGERPVDSPEGVVGGRWGPVARQRDDVRARLPVAVLADLYGEERALREPLWCVEHAARDLVAQLLG